MKQADREKEPFDVMLAKAKAMSMLLAISKRADTGDQVAIQSLAEIGGMASSMLCVLCHQQPEAVNSVASTMEEWPINVPAIQEMRTELQSLLPVTLGMATEIKPSPDGRKSRKISTGQTGMALKVYEMIRSEKLSHKLHLLMQESNLYPKTVRKSEPWAELAWGIPVLSSSSIDQWVNVGAEIILHRIKGRTHEELIPEKLLVAVVKRQKKAGISMKAALKIESVSWLKAGFRQLAKSL